MDKLPNGWKIFKYDDLKVNNDIGLVRNTNEQGESKEYKYLKMNNISIDGKLNFDKLTYVDATKNDLKKFSLKKNDFLFNTRNSKELVGKTCLFELDEENVIFNNNILRTRFNQNTNPHFVNYQFKSEFIQKQLESIKSGTTNVCAIYYKNLKDITIVLPPIPEQTRIVKKLDILFERIDKSIALLQENIRHTEALMASVLEDVFKKLVSISKVYKIKEFADIKGGKRLPKGKSLLDTKTAFPYIRVTDFNDNGSVDVESIKYMEKDVQEQIKRYIITSKDVYISIAGTIGKTGIIPNELNNANLTENAARLVFKPNFEINNRFIYYFTLSDNFKDQIGFATKTVAQPKLALTRLAEVELPIPILDIQNKEVLIFDELSKKFQEIKIQQQSKLNYLKAMKASLLDKAFKGEL